VSLNIADIFDREGSNAWFTKTAEELLLPGTKCPQCGSGVFKKENNILDVWFESGASHNVLGRRSDLPWPADMYIEGHDQYRGWFNSSLLVGVAAKGASPYRTCITHGFVLDEQGRGMSKSLGNIIEPEEIVSKNGAEILRLWVAMLNYKEDARFGGETLQRLIEAYRKIRNTWRFILGNLEDFVPDEDSLKRDDMVPFDRWILEECSELGKKVLKAYEAYEYHLIYHQMYNFFTVDLSAYYLDVLKDRLYCSGKNSLLRKSAQTALFELLKATLILAAPLLPFTTEEAWEAMPSFQGKEESVHLELFPSFDKEWMSSRPFKEWKELKGVRESVLKELEIARESKLIGNSLEAQVRLKVPPNLQDILEKYAAELASLFIVSSVEFESHSGTELGIKVSKAEGDKCQRCWSYSSYVGTCEAFPVFCERCENVVKEMDQ
jgi:isoleucyl-tRNA synthetase